MSDVVVNINLNYKVVMYGALGENLPKKHQKFYEIFYMKNLEHKLCIHPLLSQVIGS